MCQFLGHPVVTKLLHLDSSENRKTQKTANKCENILLIDTISKLSNIKDSYVSL